MFKTIKTVAFIAFVAIIANRIAGSIYVSDATILFEKDMCGAFQNSTKSHIAINEVRGQFPQVQQKDEHKYCVVRGLLSKTLATAEPVFRVEGVGTFLFSQERIIMMNVHASEYVFFKNWD